MILFKVFGLFLSAQLGMEALVVAQMPLCPHAQGPASFGTPAASHPHFRYCMSWETAHKPCAYAFYLWDPQIHTPPRPQKTNFVHRLHHPFLSDSSFSGSFLWGPMHLKQKPQWCWLQDVSKYMKMFLITLGSPRTKSLTLLLGSGDGNIYIFIIFSSLF